MTTCTWDPVAGWLQADGRPCPKTHCALRGKCANHVDVAAGLVTCASCIGRVRANLRSVAAMYAVALPVEALRKGTNSEAVNMLGPAVPGVGVDWRRGWCEWPHRDEHPLVVLGDWDMALRDTYGPPTTLGITVERAVAYLTGLLAGSFPHGDEFEEFARSISALRSRMERVIHDERGLEKGAECPLCAQALANAAQSDAQAEFGQGDADDAARRSDRPTAPRLVKRWANGEGPDAIAGRHDTWHCPAEPEHWWSQADYELMVESTQRERVKAGKWLTANEIAEQYAVKPATLRKWASRELVKSRWIGEALRYDTSDVKEMKDA